MNYHDYELRSYWVSDFGKTITLDLVLDDSRIAKEERESKIQFTDVAVYRFIHTGGAIIIDIAETPISQIPKEVESDLIEYSRQHGGTINFDGDSAAGKAKLELDGYKLWTIWSAIGFSGIIIAKSVK